MNKKQKTTFNFTNKEITKMGLSFLNSIDNDGPILNIMGDEAMFCSVCGKEDEGLDTDDVCMACGGVANDPR